jgi:hypothetical protein
MVISEKAASNLAAFFYMVLRYPKCVKIISMKLRIPLILLSMFILVSCSGPAATQQALIPADKIQPEGVVQQFLTDFQEAPMQLNGYLSPKLQKSTPIDQYQKLLPIDGMIEGFAVQSASRSGEEAVVTVAIRAGGAESIFQFNLIKANQNWYIDSIVKAL